MSLLLDSWLRLKFPNFTLPLSSMKHLFNFRGPYGSSLADAHDGQSGLPHEGVVKPTESQQILMSCEALQWVLSLLLSLPKSQQEFWSCKVAFVCTKCAHCLTVQIAGSIDIVFTSSRARSNPHSHISFQFLRDGLLA